MKEETLRAAAQAVVDRWETPLWKDAPHTAGYIAALRDALAADHSEDKLDMVGRWYMIDKIGMALLCGSQADAEQEAADAQMMWPHMGPHRAVQLVETSQAFAPADIATAAADGFRAVLCSLLRECLPVIDALMQIPGDDDSDASLNGLAGRITGALVAVEKEREQEVLA